MTSKVCNLESKLWIKLLDSLNCPGNGLLIKSCCRSESGTIFTRTTIQRDLKQSDLPIGWSFSASPRNSKAQYSSRSSATQPEAQVRLQIQGYSRWTTTCSFKTWEVNYRRECAWTAAASKKGPVLLKSLRETIDRFETFLFLFF